MKNRTILTICAMVALVLMSTQLFAQEKEAPEATKGDKVARQAREISQWLREHPDLAENILKDIWRTRGEKAKPARRRAKAGEKPARTKGVRKAPPAKAGKKAPSARTGRAGLRRFAMRRRMMGRGGSGRMGRRGLGRGMLGRGGRRRGGEHGASERGLGRMRRGGLGRGMSRRGRMRGIGRRGEGSGAKGHGLHRMTRRGSGRGMRGRGRMRGIGRRGGSREGMDALGRGRGLRGRMHGGVAPDLRRFARRRWMMRRFGGFRRPEGAERGGRRPFTPRERERLPDRPRAPRHGAPDR